MRISDWSSDVCSSDLERGEAVAVQLADSLVNPLYYFDLDAIGVVVRNELRQSDVSYVIVYDNAGAVIHDGSSDISTYGQAMQDPLAFEAVAARDVHMQVQMERSEEHTSELQSLMRISYAVFCLKKKNKINN